MHHAKQGHLILSQRRKKRKVVGGFQNGCIPENMLVFQ